MASKKVVILGIFVFSIVTIGVFIGAKELLQLSDTAAILVALLCGISVEIIFRWKYKDY